ncbi:hypothetical protein shim_26000 [Shimia sp. SK013]|uniref:hypothetical protein n=1 Tax=Shimia sp. SK013 TaxID=1389006 RepID=UPI0006B483BB|nr:hypothetical protein [Shimia sp. SK013]KPA21135.1 hypothetical protein shim_26000 [Shimia sp. SK013]
MNGAIGAAVPVVSDLLGDEIGFFRKSTLREELTIPLTPQTDEDAYQLSIPLGQSGSIRLVISQDPAGVSAPADLKGVGDLQTAITTAKVLQVNDDNSISPIRKTLQEQFVGTVNFNNGFFSNQNNDLDDLRDNCQDLRTAMSGFGMTHTAVEHLIALMVREYLLTGKHADARTVGQTQTVGNNSFVTPACVSTGDYEAHRAVVFRNIGPAPKKCSGKIDWVVSEGSSLHNAWRDVSYEQIKELFRTDKLDLSQDEVNRAYREFSASRPERENDPQADYVDTVLVPMRKGCYHSLASEKYALQPEQYGYCNIAYALFSNDRDPIWVQVQSKDGKGMLAEANIGIQNIGKLIDFSKISATGTSTLCAAEIKRQKTLIKAAEPS